MPSTLDKLATEAKTLREMADVAKAKYHEQHRIAELYRQEMADIELKYTRAMRALELAIDPTKAQQPPQGLFGPPQQQGGFGARPCTSLFGRGPSQGGGFMTPEQARQSGGLLGMSQTQHDSGPSLFGRGPSQGGGLLSTEQRESIMESGLETAYENDAEFNRPDPAQPVTGLAHDLVLRPGDAGSVFLSAPR